jgi:hypothetical protein
MRRDLPPRVATWLIGRILPERDREAVLGDLVEEYAVRVRSETRATVSRWYWGQVCRSTPQMLWCRIRAGHWLRTTGVAASAYIAASTVEFLGTAAISKVLAPDGRLFLVVSLLFGLATIVLGGYFAARIRPAAASALAAIVIIVIVIVFVTMRRSAPLWYGLTFLVFGPVAALAGGTLCRVRRTDRAV